MTSLEGAPVVSSKEGFPGALFSCRANPLLDNLRGLPSEVYDLNLSDSNIKSLEGGPQKVHNLNLENNRLRSLKGCPQTITGSIDIRNNFLTTLQGIAPEVKQKVACDFNPLESLDGLVKAGAIFCGMDVEDDPDANIHLGNTLKMLKGKIHTSPQLSTLIEEAEARGFKVLLDSKAFAM